MKWFLIGIAASVVVGVLGAFFGMLAVSVILAGVRAVIPTVPIDGKAAAYSYQAFCPAWVLLIALIGCVPGFPRFLTGFLILLPIPGALLAATWILHG